MGRSRTRAAARTASYLDGVLDDAAVAVLWLGPDGAVSRTNRRGVDVDLAGAVVLRTVELRELHTVGGEPCLVVVAPPSHDQPLQWQLTAREREVLGCIAAGLSNKQIAVALGVAEVTVENHLTRVFRKAGVTSRTSLISALLHGAKGFP